LRKPSLNVKNSKKKVSENEMIVDNLHQKLTEAEAEIREKNIMKTKSEKLVIEMKSIRNDKDELVKQNKAVNVALKSSQKDLKDSTHRYNKKIGELEAKIEDLTKLKILKNSEGKELRNMKKKLRRN
jgi:alpha/beta superfamily hydrolase